MTSGVRSDVWARGWRDDGSQNRQSEDEVRTVSASFMRNTNPGNPIYVQGSDLAMLSPVAVLVQKYGGAASPMCGSSVWWPRGMQPGSSAMTSWCLFQRWATPRMNCWPWPSRCLPNRIAGSWPCSCRRASAFQALLRSPCREHGGDAISLREVSPASSPTTVTSTPGLSKCVRFGVQDELARGKVVVIAGSQGVSYRRTSPR